MEELIVIKKSEGGKQIVSARELYEFLEIKDNFTQWIQRMLDYGFVENIDYKAVKIFVNASNGIGGTNKIEYLLTLDTAKEIAMIQRTEKGKIARQYFIECERKLKEVSVPQTYAQALLEAGRLALEVEKQQAQIQIMKPKAEFFDSVTGSKDAIDIGTAAKVLNMGIGRNKLFQLLRDESILLKGNLPAQSYIDRGWFRAIEQKYDKPDGSTHISIKTVVYQKGLDGIRKLLTKKV